MREIIGTKTQYYYSNTSVLFISWEWGLGEWGVCCASYTTKYVLVVDVLEDGDGLRQLLVNLALAHALGALLQQRITVLSHLDTTSQYLATWNTSQYLATST